jgi:hypothetical protein
MDGIINIGGRELGIKEYNGQRVVTFRDIDELHQRPEFTASRNFSQNRRRFIKGTDYFRLSQKETQSTNFADCNSPKGLILITESGYLMLVKSFTDDLAWAVQRELVNAYFRPGIISREVGRIVRRELTDAIKDAGLNDEMHGFAYKTFTDLEYKMVLGMTAKQYRTALGLPVDANVRQHVNEFQRQSIARLENAVQGMVDIGMKYGQIKDILTTTFLGKPKTPLVLT